MKSVGIFVVVVSTLWGFVAVDWSGGNSVRLIVAWTFAQAMLWPCKWIWHSESSSSLCHSITKAAWIYWEENDAVLNESMDEQIATVDVQEHLDDLLPYLEATYGRNWRKRPLLLQNLWTRDALKDSQRRLSLIGLLQERLEVPYFTDASRQGALTQDNQASVSAIVANMTLGHPHKIGTQLLVQTYPELINEVAPLDIVTKLFGHFFSKQAVVGSGPFGLLPALTTVPVFIANGTVNKQSPKVLVKGNDKSSHPTVEGKPYTPLHCEPIGNIAVQLSGQKRWTLVDPEYWHLLRPTIAPDGRAFFASWVTNYSHIPTYTTITAAGDAIWVPTWTWHRVDYIDSDDMAIGGSLFHFRPIDFVRNNPLFSLIVLPAIVLELIGYNTQ